MFRAIHPCRCPILAIPIGNPRPGDSAAQAFERLALMGGTAHPRMQAEAVRVDAARLRGIDRSTGDGLQTQTFLPRPRPQRNAIGARAARKGVSARSDWASAR